MLSNQTDLSDSRGFRDKFSYTFAANPIRFKLIVGKHTCAPIDLAFFSRNAFDGRVGFFLTNWNITRLDMNLVLFLG